MRGRVFPVSPTRLFLARSLVKSERGLVLRIPGSTGGMSEMRMLPRSQRADIGMCGASNAHQVQRRTAKLGPDWLKDSATASLHSSGSPCYLPAGLGVAAVVVVGVRPDGKGPAAFGVARKGTDILSHL